MKKKSRWFKWQVGGFLTLILSLILNTIRTDPAFAIAQQKAS
ncbi:hypothetical protein [Paenibacillus agricola]|nr:hypothetical protein [Paenibacillus agricola]